MSGTIAGGRKAKETNYKIHGRDFYKIIGAKGGRASHTGGFATSHEWAVECGRKSAIARYGIKKEEA